jgi:hypothetical protein
MIVNDFCSSASLLVRNSGPRKAAGRVSTDRPSHPHIVEMEPIRWQHGRQTERRGARAMGIPKWEIGGRSLVLLGFAFFFNYYVFCQSSRNCTTEPKSKEQLEQLIYDSVKGPDLFRTRYAVCHGAMVKAPGGWRRPEGEGARFDRAGEKQRRAVPICQGAQGDYGRRRVSFSRLSRDAGLGADLRQADQDFGNVRVQNLVKYLESIQHK